MMRKTTPLLAAAMLAFGAAAAPTAVMAQDDATQEQAQTYSKAELEAFLSAASQVGQIGSTYAPQLESASSEEDKQAVRQEAAEEMVVAIEDAGLTVERFNEISIAAQSNAELANRLKSLQQTM